MPRRGLRAPAHSARMAWPGPPPRAKLSPRLPRNGAGPGPGSGSGSGSARNGRGGGSGGARDGSITPGRGGRERSAGGGSERGNVERGAGVSARASLGTASPNRAASARPRARSEPLSRRESLGGSPWSPAGGGQAAGNAGGEGEAAQRRFGPPPGTGTGRARRGRGRRWRCGGCGEGRLASTRTHAPPALRRSGYCCPQTTGDLSALGQRSENEDWPPPLRRALPAAPALWFGTVLGGLAGKVWAASSPQRRPRSTCSLRSPAVRAYPGDPDAARRGGLRCGRRSNTPWVLRCSAGP